MVIAVEPERLLRYTWRNGPLDTVVTWRLVPEGKGTRVLLEHHGFDLSDPAQRRRGRPEHPVLTTHIIWQFVDL